MNARALSCILAILFLPFVSVKAQAVEEDHLVAPTEDVLFYTSEWDGERLSDGRPDVSDDLLERLKGIRIEDAWQYLYERGYKNQYEGGWKKLHSDRPMVGQVLTAQFMPERPDIKEKLVEEGTEAGHMGPMNTWPIDMLQQGDIYLADSYGKIAQGTLIGSNLGNSIFDNSGNGVIFNGSLRDGEDLEKIDGFNAFVRDWHPSFLEQTMLTGINVPIRIGKVTVMPGDVVLAKKRGIVFIPPHMVEGMVITAEIVKLRDEFAQERMEAGVYTAGQIDTKWTEEIEEDFLGWLRDNRMDQLPVSIEKMKEYLQERTW
ncbi:RraA family protein [Fodinibius sediminis]|uniref:Putative 4-hydroxy-4-methyl-2-oxoglutarate aldolase n=1 Tax=Fodinibius sediminis TaxID=1214077 RepID=A0A521E0S5_9BACT|nr:RraA family protein [Fodinibius sediminis]SMO77559.1 Regulator of RNase E activity RraA [Fodinibius sediminis]